MRILPFLFIVMVLVLQPLSLQAQEAPPDPPPVWVQQGAKTGANAAGAVGGAANTVGNVAGAAGNAIGAAGDLYGGLQGAVDGAVGAVNDRLAAAADAANGAIQNMLGCQQKLDFAWEQLITWHTRMKNAILRMVSGLSIMNIGFIRRFVERQIKRLDDFVVGQFEGYSLQVIRACNSVGIEAPSFNPNILPDLGPQISAMGAQLSSIQENASNVSNVAGEVGSDLGNVGNNNGGSGSGSGDGSGGSGGGSGKGGGG